MSRHSFQGKARATRVVLGWDRPLATFFVQVFGPDPDEDGEEMTFLWRGTAPGELPTAAAALALASPYAELPDTLAATLETDRLRTVATPDGREQIAAKRLLFGD